MPTVHVIGLGRSGIAAARLLKRQGWQVEVSDSRQTPALQSQQQLLEAEGIAVQLNYDFDLQTLASVGLRVPDEIVISPGVPWYSPALVAARQAGIPVRGEVEIAWQTLAHLPWVCITGTNGKTTTTALTAAIFQAAGYNAPACGNIGNSICEVALTASALDWVIAEISSYQLESSPPLQPQFALWTTLTPDHLERHGTLDAYVETKAHLMNGAKQVILNGDDPYLRQHMVNRWPQAWWISTQGAAALPKGIEQGIYIAGDQVWFQDQPLLPTHVLQMPGQHNQQNFLLAVATAHLAGIPAETIAKAVAGFAGVPHRLERIRQWRQVEWINDSKATNYDAAEIGLRSVTGPVILIAGGQAKKGDDRAWLNLIQEKAAWVLLIGEAAPQFAQRLEAIGFTNYEIMETLDRAVAAAAELVTQYPIKTVLFSPACASFDQYQNFEERGDHFRQLCLEL
ncbi:UDP-N-acetylmuramoyl-L-alanine--D-glutamate ligase [Thermosynechococcus sp. FA-CM-4201]